MNPSESLNYSLVVEYLESLMVEGSVGNKLDLLTLSRLKMLLKVDMS